MLKPDGRVIMVSGASRGIGREIVKRLLASGFSVFVGYAMTKHALTALSHGIRREARDLGIRTTVICPGLVATEMDLKNPVIPVEDMSQPDDIAALVEIVLNLPTTLRFRSCLFTHGLGQCSEHQYTAAPGSRRCWSRASVDQHFIVVSP